MKYFLTSSSKLVFSTSIVIHLALLKTSSRVSHALLSPNLASIDNKKHINKMNNLLIQYNGVILVIIYILSTQAVFNFCVVAYLLDSSKLEAHRSQ